MRRVWIGLLLLLLLLLLSPAWVWAEPITLAWDAVTTNADATPITDLSHYAVRWGTSTGVYEAGQIVGSGVTQLTVKGLNPSFVYFFSVVAVDTSGHESALSNEVSARPTLVLHQ